MGRESDSGTLADLLWALLLVGIVAVLVVVVWDWCAAALGQAGVLVGG